MPPKGFKDFRVRVYHVETGHRTKRVGTPFQEAIEATGELDRESRLKTVGGKERLLDRLSWRDGVLLLNFVTSKYDGPATIRVSSPLYELELDEDENFAVETAALYDPGTRYIYTETNDATRNGSIFAKYFAQFADKGTYYEMYPVLDTGVAAKVRNFQLINKVEFDAYLGRITEEDREAGLGVIEAFDGVGGGIVQVQLRPETRGFGHGLTAGFRRVINSMMSGDTVASPISRLRVSGITEVDSSAQVIDLVQNPEKYATKLALHPDQRRIAVETKWDALCRFREQSIRGNE